MEVEYSLTAEDLEAFCRFHFKQAAQKSVMKPRRTASNIAWGAGMLFIIIYSWFSNDTKLQGIAWFGLGVLFGMGTVFIAFLLIKRKKTINYAKDIYADEHSRWKFSRKRLIINANGIAVISDYQNAVQKWSVVWKIAATEHHVFLYEGKDSSTIVPRCAFRDQQHFEEFVALARKYQQGGGQEGQKPTGILAALPPQSDAFIRPDVP